MNSFIVAEPTDVVTPVLDDWCDLPEGRWLEVATGGHSFSAWMPCHYEPTYNYPLLVWLDGSDLVTPEAVVPQISDRNYVAVRVPLMLPATTLSGNARRHAEVQATQQILTAIDAVAAEFSINRQRVILVASGRAAELARSFETELLDQMRGVVIINPVLETARLLVGRHSRMKARAVFLADLLPPASQQDLKLLDAGLKRRGADVTLVTGQNVTSRLNAWIMEQVSRRAFAG